MKQRNLAMFGLVDILVEYTLTMIGFQGLITELEVPSSDPESQSWSKSISAIPTSPNMDTCLNLKQRAGCYILALESWLGDIATKQSLLDHSATFCAVVRVTVSVQWAHKAEDNDLHED
ncbi:hypothetical protein EVAR_84683_1 [Eumeta japonica]|uniref:Uncharacterized protein n=1 Tax=Eumeta variegata TaxID=151549 RepID=A0A4C2A1U5_EUMVA|nr:hypothetical protein EVAR_84683_1 [Eumeta japonica]